MTEPAAPEVPLDPADAVSLVRLARGALRHLRLLLILPVAGIVLVVGYTLIWGDAVASSSFVPQVSTSSASKIAGVAAQFGISLGGAPAGETVEFYGALLTSREMLRALAQTTFHCAKSAGSRDTLEGTFIALYKVEGETPTKQLKAAVTALRDLVDVKTVTTSQLVILKTSARWPGLAEALNRRLLDLVNDFNLRRHQSSAALERRFTEGRLADARVDLRSAEVAMERFLEQNRTYRSSPALTFEASRLQRQVDLQKSLITTLEQSYEQSRQDEVRDTPMLTLVDRPEGSVIPAATLGGRAVLGAFLGAFLAFWLSLGLEWLAAERRRRPVEWAELVVVLTETKADLTPKVLWGRLKGLAARLRRRRA